MIKIILLLLTFHLLVSSSPAQGALDSDGYRRLRNASLEILVGGQLRGSGWFAAPHGLAITAAHILKGSGQIEVLSPVAGRLRARVISKDYGHDLALLSVERPGDLFPALELASTPPLVGEKIYSFGSPLNRHELFFEGSLSREETQFEWNELNHTYTEVYAVSAMTPAGLSGAPWVNAAGDVVGVQSGMMIWKDALMGMAFVAPTEPVRHMLASKKGRDTLSLGATFAEPWEGGTEEGGVARKEGLRISKLENNGALKAAGAREGDILYAVEGRTVRYRDDLLRQLTQFKVDTLLRLSIGKEAGERRDIMIRLTPM